jgi:hypothetical protein
VELADSEFPLWLRRVDPKGNASIRILLCRPARDDPKRVLRIVQVGPEPGETGFIASRVLEAFKTFGLLAARSVDGFFLAWLEGPAPVLCSRVFRLGGLCLTCTNVSSVRSIGPGRRGVVLPDARSVRSLIGSASQDSTRRSDILRISRFSVTSLLTARQDEALEVAARAGFFSTPRRGHLNEVAVQLGVSRAATMSLLRRSVERLALDRLDGRAGSQHRRPSRLPSELTQ